MSALAMPAGAALPVAWAAYAGLNSFSPVLLPHAIQDVESRGRPLPIDPAPYAFAIWGPIFLGQGAFAAYQVGRDDPRFAAARGPLLATFALGTAWPIAVSFERMDVACGVLLGMLGTGLMAYRRLCPPDAPAASWRERVLVRWPAGAYVGWLSLAAVLSVAGVATETFGLRTRGATADRWASGGIGALGATGAAVGALRGEAAYGSAVAWGLVAIAARQRRPAVRAAVAGALGVIALGVLAGRR